MGQRRELSHIEETAAETKTEFSKREGEKKHDVDFPLIFMYVFKIQGLNKTGCLQRYFLAKILHV